MSAAIISRSMACVDQRSSRSRIGRPRSSMLRAKARLDWLRGLSLPSMFSGRPTTMPLVGRVAIAAVSATLSLENLVRLMRSAGDANVQPASQNAVPMVLLPMSRPSRTPPSGNASRKSAMAPKIILRDISACAKVRPPARLPRIGDNHTHDNYFQAVHMAPCPQAHQSEGSPCRRSVPERFRG